MADMAAVSHPRRVPRPGAVPAAAQVQRDHGFRSNQNFQPLPKPTGAYPYRLRLDPVLAPSAVSAIQSAGELAFHLVGDTGGVKNPQPHQTVADHMGQDFSGAGTPAPSFFYHLGDVVYFYGQSSEYYPQFYEPYSLYPAPIMGIPGNHDGDPGAPATEPSLAGFVNNFCADRPHLTRDAQEIHRDAMTQPHVYWTLLAPFLTIIGLYTNVPEGGSSTTTRSHGWRRSCRRPRPTGR